MSVLPAHFDLTGRRIVIVGSETPAGDAITRAYREAGADLALLPSAVAREAATAIPRAASALDGLEVVVAALDHFEASPLAASDDALFERLFARNCLDVARVLRAAATLMQARPTDTPRSLIVVTHALGSRGLPNCAAYCAAHGAVVNLLRALAQELAPHGISVNGIALGWMDWMTDRLDPTDEEAARAVRFTISKRAGQRDDLGPLAVWLAGTGVGYVGGQIFPLDGGLTQHL